MKLKLNKKKLKNLSQDLKTLPAELTKEVAGGVPQGNTDMTLECHTPWCTVA